MSATNSNVPGTDSTGTGQGGGSSGGSAPGPAQGNTGTRDTFIGSLYDGDMRVKEDVEISMKSAAVKTQIGVQAKNAVIDGSLKINMS